MKTDLFQSCGHCWVYQICWHIEYCTLTESSFSILNSSTGILSPPLALFVVMLPKAHMTSHSRMSGSRQTIIVIPVIKIFFCIVLCILATSSYSLLLPLGAYISVLYCAHPCMKCSLGISSFLEEPLVFPILLFSSISLHCLLKKALHDDKSQFTKKAEQL